MSTTFSRLVRRDDIPDSLWDRSDQVLSLAPSLVAAYTTLLDRHGLRTLAMQAPPPDGPVGGVTKDETDKHLAWAFPGSAARVQLAVLDPRSDVPHIADAFTRLLAGNKVAIADVPCGSGAAVLSILATIAELRKQQRVPREPLDLVIVTGEISEFARRYTVEGFGELRQLLEEQAIWIETVCLHWDVCDKLSNTDLIREITVRSRECGARLLVVANFSGCLQRGGKFKQAQPQLEELFRHVRGGNSSAIWVEPQTNVAAIEGGGLFARLTDWFKQKWASFVRVRRGRDDSEPVGRASCKCQHPLRTDSCFEARLSVLRCDLHSE
jgi:hypothetical protein